MIYRCHQPGCGWVSLDIPKDEAFTALSRHQREMHPNLRAAAGSRPKGGRRSRQAPPEAQAEGKAAQDGGERRSTTAAYPLGFRIGSVGLDPVVHLRYRTWVEQAAYDGSFEDFLNEATDVVTKLKGLVPAGYYIAGGREEERNGRGQEPHRVGAGTGPPDPDDAGPA